MPVAVSWLSWPRTQRRSVSWPIEAADFTGCQIRVGWDGISPHPGAAGAWQAITFTPTSAAADIAGPDAADKSGAIVLPSASCWAELRFTGPNGLSEPVLATWFDLFPAS